MRRISGLFVMAMTGACTHGQPASSGADAATPDASSCSARIAAPSYCVPNGLANFALDGTWQLVGTEQQSPNPMPISITVTIAHSGSGSCAFGIACTTSSCDVDTATIGAASAGYIDATVAGVSRTGTGFHNDPESFDSIVCVDASGKLVYHQNDNYYVFETQTFRTIDGVLQPAP
jgi:hypothetical protein